MYKTKNKLSYIHPNVKYLNVDLKKWQGLKEDWESYHKLP